MVVLDIAKVRTLRERLRLTQEAAAAAADLTGGRPRWNDIESGRRANVTIETLGKLATALRCDPCDLLTRPARKPR